jgi:hypothetical protein
MTDRAQSDQNTTKGPTPPHITTTSEASTLELSQPKPTILHLGDDIRWNQDLYAELTRRFNIVRTYSVGREDFKDALQEKRWGDFVGMYRPFWNTGGEMGTWNAELMYLLPPNISFSQTPSIKLTSKAPFSLPHAKSSPPPVQASTGLILAVWPPAASYIATAHLHAPSPFPTPRSFSF